jgi:hypothetical protein
MPIELLLPTWRYPEPVNACPSLSLILKDNPQLYESPSYTPQRADNLCSSLYTLITGKGKRDLLYHKSVQEFSGLYLDMLEWLIEIMSSDMSSKINISFTKREFTTKYKNKMSWESSPSLMPVEDCLDRIVVNGETKVNDQITPWITETISSCSEYMFAIEYECIFALVTHVLALMNMAEYYFCCENIEHHLSMAIMMYNHAAMRAHAGIGWCERFLKYEDCDQIECRSSTFMGLKSFCLAKAQMIKDIKVPATSAFESCERHMFVMSQMTYAYEHFNKGFDARCASGIAIFCLYYRFFYLAKVHVEYGRHLMHYDKPMIKRDFDVTDPTRANVCFMLCEIFLKLASHEYKRCKPEIKRFDEDIKSVNTEMVEYFKDMEQEHYQYKTMISKKKVELYSENVVKTNLFVYMNQFPKAKNNITDDISNLYKVAFFRKSDESPQTSTA